jgi:adenosylhomocysteinase
MTQMTTIDTERAQRGRHKIEWAWQFMPVLQNLLKRYGNERPFSGHNIGACLHLEAKTACLLETLRKLGANVYAAGSNPLSTQDDVCEALRSEGMAVYSRHRMSTEEYFENLHAVLRHDLDIIIDDGADLVATMHTDYKEKLSRILGGSEETTTGVKRLKAMHADGVLAFPMISVNDAKSKFLFDNRYGTGQSVWDGIMRTTNMLVAGKTVVVAGYGWCGRGVALRAKALGARVIITEIDPHRAFEAVMDGCDVMTMEQAAPLGDMFLTLTGNRKVIRREHFEKMKNGAVLANAGHFDVEVWKPDLTELSLSVETIRDNVEVFRMRDGRNLFLLGEGRLVNLACGDGHPIEIMDLSFGMQLESALYISRNSLRPGVYDVPEELDLRIMRTKLESGGIRLETLLPEQEAYMKGWQE